MSDEVVTRLAREAGPGVLAEALGRAREQAVTRLADLLTDAIVAEALGAAAPAVRSAPAGRTDPAGEPTARPPGDETGEALYAYGITLADLPVPDDVPALTGDAPVDRVREGELALLVSPVRPDQLRVDEDDLSETGRLATLARGHDAAVRAAATAGPVLPLRFGTVVPDRAAARRLLAQHAGSAAARLRRIGTTREWGVKLVRRLAPELVAAGARPTDRHGLTGTEYLARRREALHDQEAAERIAAQASNLLEETLRPHITESLRRGGSSGSSLLLDLALLVPPDRETSFLAAAAELRERLDQDGLEVEVSGPWPPYSFASLDDGGPDDGGPDDA
jgi:hypothetical protein